MPLISARMIIGAVVLAVAGGLAAAGGFWLAGQAGHVRPGPVLVLAAAAVVFAAVYGRSLSRRPWRKCLRCKGTGRNVDTTLFTGRLTGLGPVQGRCTCCGGRQTHVRPGVRLFQPGRARDLAAGRKGKYG